MQQEQWRPTVPRLRIRQCNDGDMQRDGVGYGVRLAADLEVDIGRRLWTWPDRKHRVTFELSLVGVMIRRIVRVFVRMSREREANRQLTSVADEGQKNEYENEGRGYPRDHEHYSSRRAILLSTRLLSGLTEPASSPTEREGLGVRIGP